MENNNNTILTDQTVSKEYQIPELVELKSVSEAIGAACSPGSSDNNSCDTGTVGNIY